MSGIRLHHPTLSNCTLVVELEQDFANSRPRFCPSCAKMHERKSIHLRLDGSGHVFVSPEVYASLLPVHLAGMEVGNMVSKPPVQILGAVEQPTTNIVEQRLNRDTNAAPAYVPGRTKYQSRDRLAAALARSLAKEN